MRQGPQQCHQPQWTPQLLLQIFPKRLAFPATCDFREEPSSVGTLSIYHMGPGELAPGENCWSEQLFFKRSPSL